MKNIIAVCSLSILLLSSCVSPLSIEEARKMPPLALCKEYYYYSDELTKLGAERKAILNRLEVIYSEIERRNINCKNIMPENKKNNYNQKGIVNCFPNQVTGGVTCF